MKVLAIGDTHLPWIDWRAMAALSKFAYDYKPDLIVQVGDFIDAQAWSKHLKHTDAPGADIEWKMIEKAAQRFDAMLPPDTRLYIIEGNHDRRHKMRAMEAAIPSQLVKPLSAMFPYKNWVWWVQQKPLSIDGVDYVHGDELGGRAVQKAGRCGRSIVQGHLHTDAGVTYIQSFHRQLFGADIGTLMDVKSLAARYAHKRLLRSWRGWATITDGVPALWPYFSGRTKVSLLERLQQASRP